MSGERLSGPEGAALYARLAAERAAADKAASEQAWAEAAAEARRVWSLRQVELRRQEAEGLPWAPAWPGRRCRARTERGERCDLVRGHPEEIDHALERGLDCPRWSTRWTA